MKISSIEAATAPSFGSAVLTPAPMFAAAIVRQHNRRLFRVARAILKDDAEAEEAVQDAYVRALTSIGSLRDQASLTGWLVRITTNEALSRLRRHRATLPLEEIADEMTADAASPSTLPGMFGWENPEAQAMQAEIRTILERAIDDLPCHFRLVFVACDVEMMSVEQAATALGLHRVTVKTRLFRARRMLRRALSTEFRSVLPEIYPCAGARCERILQAVLRRLPDEAAYNPEQGG